MKTYTASIFVELEIKVSGTLTEGCRESYDPPSPAEPDGWEDLQVEGICHTAYRYKNGKWGPLAFDLAAPETTMDQFRAALMSEFSDGIETALSAEVPDGPDPDDARCTVVLIRRVPDEQI